MKRELDRLFRPHSVAVIGGGAWCSQVIAQSRKMGFSGAIHVVHPKLPALDGAQVCARIEDLPTPPDAAFIGINRHATIEAVAALAKRGAGGAVCFASGFSEAALEDNQSQGLQQQLIAAAGEMPILGPNCYGFINALDGALLWPDQHGCARVDRGVAILTQSSNIAINLTMQARGLPIAYMVTCGNMAQTRQADIAAALLDDPRVTAIGLHIEGFGDLRGWEALAAKAWQAGIPLVAIKVGASDQAQSAAMSHTASLAGSDAGAQALLDRLGIPRLHGLPAFLECLKLLHCNGPLTGTGIASISCSGGEASLMADMALPFDLDYPALRPEQEAGLRASLGPMVSLSNPLDYHTYIWRDAEAMARAWSCMTGPGIAMTLSVVDYPRTDASDWAPATAAAIRVRRDTGAPFAVVSSLPELMPDEVASELMAAGVVPFQGMDEALAALQAANQHHAPNPRPVALPGASHRCHLMPEDVAKSALADFGLPVPCAVSSFAADDLSACCADLTPPFAVKGLGLAHKSDAGAVRLGVAHADLEAVAAEIGTEQILIEEMIPGAVAELLVGVLSDPAHGFVLTIGAGGVQTEILRDTVSVLLPATEGELRDALSRLRIAPLLNGYRGRAGANIGAIIKAIDAIQSYCLAHADVIGEVEVNPLLCTPERAVAVDALIRKA